jgi:phage antirepressor YoqD-like protein
MNEHDSVKDIAKTLDAREERLRAVMIKARVQLELTENRFDADRQLVTLSPAQAAAFEK